MKLTVLGCSGTFPAAGGACSGYLIEEDETFILLDCGNGTLGRLQSIIPIERLSAILVSHLHFDHCADLLVLRYAWETRMANGDLVSPLPLYLPFAPAPVFQLIADRKAFDIHQISPDTQVKIGPFNIKFFVVAHSIEAYAIRIDTFSGSLAYSGDSMDHPNLVEAAAGVDFYLCESTLPEGKIASISEFPHLSARQAGMIASKAGVKLLCLTHFAYNQIQGDLVNQALQEFSPVLAAGEFETYRIHSK